MNPQVKALRQGIYYLCLFFLALPISIIIGSAAILGLWHYLDFEIPGIYAWSLICGIFALIYYRFWSQTKNGISRKKLIGLVAFFILEITVYLSLM